MSAVMAHRGPDGEGVWADPGLGVGLAHRRLAIIDLEAGDQPMTDGDLTLVFNGCIYNYQDLARELRAAGHRFRTHSDTEVILKAYRQWGERCVERFNGMWAFALWDGGERRLFCSRDRVGIKPFYYTAGPDRAGGGGVSFAFASEIKSLLAGGFVRARTDEDGLRQYLTFQLCLGERTLFEGVKRLEPGHSLVVEPGREPRVTRYWDVDFTLDEDHDEDFFADRLATLLEDSVRLRLVSDVPLGAHLSGGLDSSAVVGLTRLLLPNAGLDTFTGAFPEGEAYDETRYARLVAERAGTRAHIRNMGMADFTGSIEKIIWHMDEPAAGPGVFPQYHVSRLASEHVKVVLGGQGGDELFIGYARYLVAYLEECLKGAVQNTAHRASYVTTLETIVPQLPTLEQYVPMLRDFWAEGLFGPPARRYFRLMDRSSDSRAMLSGDMGMDPEKTFGEFDQIFGHAGPASNINRILYFDLKTHLQSLLQVEDRTSMAWGLESRVPLLDYRLIEHMASVPPVIKFRDGHLKHLYRRAVKHLVPDEVFARRDKMGFPVPLNEWMKGDMGGFVRDILLDKRARERGLLCPRLVEKQMENQSRFSRGIWGAMCLELWHRAFIDDAGAQGAGAWEAGGAAVLG